MNPTMLPSIMFFKMKPTNLTFMILITSIITNLYLYHQTTNKWFPMILTLLFSGGIMMLFSFLSSTLPNIKTKKSKLAIMMLTPSIMLILTNKKSPILLNNFSLQTVYNMESNNLLILTLMLIALTLMLKSQMIKINNPLKSSQ